MICLPPLPDTKARTSCTGPVAFTCCGRPWKSRPSTRWRAPFLHQLTLLNHGQRALDLRGTSAGKRMLDMTGLQGLWLFEEIDPFLFQNVGWDACTTHVPGDDGGLTLQCMGEYRPIPEQMPELRWCCTTRSTGRWMLRTSSRAWRSIRCSGSFRRSWRRTGEAVPG